MPSVRVRRRCTVAPPAPGRRVVELLALDVLWLPLPPVRHVLLFPYSPAAMAPPSFSALCESLRRALAVALRSFHPLAGELSYSPSSGTVVIVVGDIDVGGGVAFVEAETDAEFDALAGAEELDADGFGMLAPDIRRGDLPAPVLAVQVTEFVGGGGGVGVGVALHHAAADGNGRVRFMQAWGAAAVGISPTAPLHDRRLICSELSINLFLLCSQIGWVAAQPPRRHLRRRTFTFSAIAVSHLKKRLLLAVEEPPSTFATLAAHAWVSYARAGADDAAELVFACIIADVRACLTPPVDNAYAGNCLAF